MEKFIIAVGATEKGNLMLATNSGKCTQEEADAWATQILHKSKHVDKVVFLTAVGVATR